MDASNMFTAKFRFKTIQAINFKKYILLNEQPNETFFSFTSYQKNLSNEFKQ